ncbi:hypothetical protein FZEAL_5349 [Fusarium zealandicum]|uniref:Uncharacterized protein n=1 Tax=Fusarium zealandicum TaxID=1053134 RepID=A0A8H4UKS8_9HYPO|nr:hypothetical protein FZEAL_5349 [Fusarium zealandicum]
MYPSSLWNNLFRGTTTLFLVEEVSIGLLEICVLNGSIHRKPSFDTQDPLLSCPPEATKCPIGSITTETIAVSTTVCPVTNKHVKPEEPITKEHVKPGEHETKHVKPTAPWTCEGCNSTVMATVTKHHQFTKPIGNGDAHETTVPAQPETPAHSDVPSQPENPAQPAQPAHSDVPAKPGVPAEPTGSTPNESEVPVVVVNMSNSASVSSFLAAVGLAVAVFHLL